MATHDRLDLARWLRECPLDSFDPKWLMRAQEIYGPRDLAKFEQVRAKIGVAERGRAVPTDVCVWSIGEPNDPTVTRIGGAPYRPTDAHWPTGPDGTSMGLLAQFNFTDSLDVLAPIPPEAPSQALHGDVLLVFTSGPHMYADWDADEPETWALEWHRIVPGFAPRPAPRVLDITPTFATLHRTVDYPESTAYDGLDAVWGTKFGGVPMFDQDDPELPGTPLCMLASINPFGGPWPMLNVPVNPKGEEYLDGKLLMLGDLGAANFNLDTDGQVHWSADCG